MDSAWAHDIEAVAFDMDGLMVNTEDLYTEISERILGRRGRTFSKELKNNMMGLPPERAFAVMIEWENLNDSVATLAAETAQEFTAILPTKLRLLPGLVELLDALDRKRLPRCVATSSTEQFAEKVLQTANVRERVDFVITAEHVPAGKPNPDIYLEAAKRMEVDVCRMLVLEDSHHGCQAGVKAGACTIAVPGDHSRDHDFTRVHCIAKSLGDPRIHDLL